jgi:threonine dehydrogenase-like Zn-dependent dehydrogenase
MSITGKAAVLIEPNKLETWEVPISDPEPGGILVRMVIGGVCGSDLHLYDGGAGTIPFPIILGHEGIGRVEKLGAGVETDYAGVPVAVGDLVYWAPTGLCGRCYACTILEEPPCESSQFFEHADKPNWGAFADWAWLPATMCFFRLPDGARPEALAALGCALPTAIGGYDRAGGVQLGDSVVVQGAGPVGLSATLVAGICGAEQVIVIDSVESRLEIARSLGATHTVTMNGTTPAERKEQIYELVGKQGPRIVLEATGAVPAFPEGLDLVGDQGTYIVLGLWGAMGKAEMEPRDLTIKNMKIVGDTFHRNRHYYQAMKLAAKVQDRFPLAELITDRYPVAGAREALEAIEGGNAIKAIIDPTLG